MECDICGSTKADEGKFRGAMGVGWACSDDCLQIGQGRRKAFHDELLAEPCGEMPDALETGDFERWSLKLALYTLKAITPKQRKALVKNNPLMLIPEQLALELKDQILRHIKPCYVSETEARGHERMFHGGTYCFRQPVPSAHIIEAAQKAQVIT